MLNDALELHDALLEGVVDPLRRLLFVRLRAVTECQRRGLCNFNSKVGVINWLRRHQMLVRNDLRGRRQQIEGAAKIHRIGKLTLQGQWLSCRGVESRLALGEVEHRHDRMV